MTQYRNRRSFVIGSASVAALGTTGCLGTGNDDDTDEGGGDDGGDGGNEKTVPSEVTEYLSDVSNFDGSVVDRTGETETLIKVGVEANGGNFGFGPPAVRIRAGAEAIWEWTGKGSQHNVHDEDDDYESDLQGENGDYFVHKFETAGVLLYACDPHKAQGMKGAVIVVE